MAGGGPPHIPVYAVVTTLFKFLGPILTILYPAAASFEALESPSPNDDKQWLTYWVINSLLQLFEILAQPVVTRLPLYYTIKLAFVAWLVLPQFRGALYLYLSIFRPRGLQLRSKVYEKVGDQSHMFKAGDVDAGGKVEQMKTE